jgi:glycosyltransferase involved in cell wall biosynthesis
MLKNKCPTFYSKPNNVTVFLEVYNEEHRLADCLINFQWAEELVVFVKSSSDNSLSIAKLYATHVYEVEFCSASQNFAANVKRHSAKEWCMFITASSLIDPELVDFLINKLNDPSFAYDVVGLPYQMMVFGLTGNVSPWGTSHKHSVIRRSSLVLSDVLHREISWTGNRVIEIDPAFTTGKFYHCTHSNPDDFFSRHMRYVKYEASELVAINKNKSLRIVIFELIKSVASVLLKKRTLIRGETGFILSLAYVSYFLMKVVYVWYARRGISDPYAEIRRVAVDKWEKRQL